MPRLANYVHKKQQEDFRRSVAESAEFTLMAGLSLTIYFLFMAPECVMFLFGAENLPAASVLRVLAPAVLLIGCSNVTGVQILTPTGREKIVMWSVVTGAAVDLLLNFLFIPRFRAVGAALGTLIAELAVLGVQLWFLRDFFRDVGGQIRAGKILAASLLAAAAPAAVKLLPVTAPFLRILVSAVGYFGMLAVLLVAMKVPTAKMLWDWGKGLFRKK